MVNSLYRSIAHIRDNDVQTIGEHLKNVSNMSSRIGALYNLENTCYLAGILHDIGKLNPEFQDYIQNANNKTKKGKIDHSTYGARLIYEEFGKSNDIFECVTVEIISLVIMSHHGGLQDFLSPYGESDFLRRNLDKGSKLPYFEEIKTQFFKEICSQNDFKKLWKKSVMEITEHFKNIQHSKLGLERSQFHIGLLVKLIFSILIEADRTDTAQFMEQLGDYEELEVDWDCLIDKLEKHLKNFKIKNDIDKWRRIISDECADFANQSPDIYDLTVPTGSGKTLASLRYALHHARNFNKRRIFFILPYTTIIEQNAMVVGDILGEKTVTEHHSGIIRDDNKNNYDKENYNKKDYSEENYDQSSEIRRFAQINWDTPIIFTTMVQFLNIFYNSGTKDVRRLHSFGQSVVIFDEVQSVPKHTLNLFNESVNFLKNQMHATVVLSTATQPTLEKMPKSILKSQNQMIKNIDEKYRAFSRVNLDTEFIKSKKALKCDEIAELAMSDIERVNNILIVVNLTKTARDIFHELKKNIRDMELVHLSTKMCPAHRKNVLAKVRDLLKEGKKLICVTTPLIEAGVDVSFQMVYRSLAGAASIAQAAGRCNRHGESGEKGVVKILDVLSDQNTSFLRDIKIGADISKELIHRKFDLLSLDGSNAYFERFFRYDPQKFNYEIVIEGNRFNLYDLLARNQKGEDSVYSKGQKNDMKMHQAFKTASRAFKVIDNKTSDVFVPYGNEGKQAIIELLSQSGVKDLSRFLKQNQAHTVSLYDYEMKALLEEGALECDKVWGLFILKEGVYSEDVGVDIQERSLTNNVII